jgi:hypothetical protein
MSEKRKRYTPAEKAKIALEAIKSENTIILPKNWTTKRDIKVC